MFEYLYEQDIKAMEMIMLPKLLFSSPQFIMLSAQAKVLYAILLDSCEEGAGTDRPSTTMPIYEICEDMCCSSAEAAEMLRELADFGLICCEGSVVYVNDFKRTEV